MFTRSKTHRAVVERAEKAEARVNELIEEIADFAFDNLKLQDRVRKLDNDAEALMQRALEAEKLSEKRNEVIIELQGELARYKQGLAKGSAASAAKRRLATAAPKAVAQEVRA